MRRFVFPLARVLEWRRLQLRGEESKLEQLYAEQRALDLSRLALEQQAAQAEAEVRAQGAIDARELSALHSFQQHAAAERRRLAQAHAGCAQRIARQFEAVVAKKRETRLLEMLYEKRRAAWIREGEQEITRQAEESHLAKWKRRNIQ